ncbi:protein arginine N-methyltransferase 1 [Phytophthora cinnamomi]|uniref:protein arginine N-methyltransferase 1 n=1 Tax=Phytophthora cinnamomi TaxID=4785 RepID=UPI00355A8989|nr:protein arginine N-methyltransferase 1 [Phytophthora cinnamomi]
MFKGLVVLDVDYGTGILSMIAAKAGTKHVYGVDCSGILAQAREIVKANGFADKITLTQGKMQELTLPVDKVDIIISEWMGYFVLYESMLETALYARDKYLVPGGLMSPDHITIYIGAIDDGDACSYTTRTCAPILDIDLTKATKEELAFSSTFKLTVFRQDSCHALVAYFDCTFSATHMKISFSTGFKADYTHWK